MRDEAPGMFDRRLPLWYQLAQMLRGEILAGTLGAGERLPPEPALARRHGVSVVTVRQALRTLGDEGLITRHRGRGTFVTGGPHHGQELRLLGSVDAVIAQQYSEQTEVLERATVPVPPALARHFPDETEVVFFRRLRREGGRPLSCALNWVVPEYGRQIDAARLQRDPMLKILRDTLGVKLSDVQIAVEARRASQEIAAALGIDVMSPVLFFSGVVLDLARRVVDVAWIHYRADRFTFTLDVDVRG